MCECGLNDHKDQIEKYPVGTKIIFSDEVFGEVASHCDDGRAVVKIGPNTYTFHHLDSYAKHVELPPEIELAKLKAENDYLFFFRVNAPTHVVDAIDAAYVAQGKTLPVGWADAFALIMPALPER